MRKLAGLLAAVALCAGACGCSTTELAEAGSGRYEVEQLDTGGAATALRVVTDTETGQAWLVASTIEGGVAIERLSPYVQVGMSDDRGE